MLDAARLDTANLTTVKDRIRALQAEATARVASQQRLDEVQQQPQGELERLRGAVIPGLSLPKIKL